VSVPLPSDGSQHQDDLLELVRQAQAGSNQAAHTLLERCREPLLIVIRKLLSPVLRRLYDSNDFLAETFAAIFMKHFSDEVLESPESFWLYLKKTAQNKVRDAQRKYLVAKRRDLRREVPLDEIGIGKELWSNELSPADALLLKELVEDRLEHLMKQVPPLMAAILELLLQGYNSVEIAHLLGLQPKRVYRAMEWLRNKILED
jgi:RNA polymerase sigma factor (sigma-70 family)